MIDNPVSDLISKDLRRWFKEKWVDVGSKDKDGKHPPCGRSEAKTNSKGYPKCRPSKKVSEDTPKTTRGISSKEKKAMTRRKRSKPQGVGGKPTMVKSDFNPFNAGGKRLIDAYAGSGRTDELRRIMEAMKEIPKEVQIDEGDECCEEARMQFREALRKHFGRASWNDVDMIVEGSCEELQGELERWISQKWDADSDKDTNGITLHEDLMRIQNNWDACSSKSQGGDMGFYASADPFEAAWDSISKDFYFDNSYSGQGSLGEFVGPRAKGITQIADAKGRKTGIKGLFSNRRRDIEAEEEDGNPSSQNVSITGDAINDRRRRYDTNMYDSSERKERGEDATPNNAQSPSNFRRGGSLPRTTKVATDMPNYQAESFIDVEGKPMDSKGKKEEWGTWDRTGKRQFRSNQNKPIHFEGQKRNYATHVGANLTPLGTEMKEGRMSEDEGVQSLTNTLGHEYTHSAIDEELKEAIKRGDLSPEHYNSAHEVGAHIGQYADLDDEQMEENVNRRLSQHPNTSWLNRHGKTPEKFRGKDNQLKMPKVGQSSDDIKQASFDQAWSSIAKGRFHGYTQSNISNRPYRQAEHRVWDISRKVKRERTKRRYARNKSRGTVRPAMRRQLGAGGKRASTKR